MEIFDFKNREKIAIVVIGYNRIKTLMTLLNSLNKADYPTEDVPLTISIDKSDNDELYNYVRNFVWNHGEKYAIIRQEKLGLERHIFECGNLSKYFRAVIILEDDVVVAPDFYKYFLTAVNKYEDETQVSCISAYFNFLYGYVGLPFYPMSNHDVFAQQEVSSTGECFTKRMWNEFVDWKNANTPLDFDPFDMPERIKKWKDAWTKYFNAYMVSHDKYCIYPIFSTITNSGAAGVHSTHSETSVQTLLMTGHRIWDMPKFEDLVKYDLYGNNQVLYETLRLSKEELCLDMYGNNPNIRNKKYTLSIKRLPYQVIKGYEMSYRPHELNIIYNHQGNDIHLFDTRVKSKGGKGGYTNNVLSYYLYGFHVKFLPLYSLCKIARVIKERFLKKLHF